VIIAVLFSISVESVDLWNDEDLVPSISLLVGTKGYIPSLPIIELLKHVVKLCTVSLNAIVIFVSSCESEKYGIRGLHSP